MEQGLLTPELTIVGDILQAQTAQVAELKGQVAQLTARCHSMEQVLTQQQLTGSSGDLRASPTAAEANEANLRSIPSTGSPAATAQVSACHRSKTTSSARQCTQQHSVCLSHMKAD